MRFQENLTSREAVLQELEDNGLDIKPGGSIVGVVESINDFSDIPEMSNFIYNYKDYGFLWEILNDDYQDIDYQKIEAFGKINSINERIKFLSKLKFSEIGKALEKYALNSNAFKYFLNRLSYYNDALRFGIVDQYGDVVIPTVDDVKTGLWRDSIFALMFGTPEMAIMKIVNRKLGTKMVDLRPKCKYSWENVNDNENDNNNNHYNNHYEIVSRLYEDALKIIKRKYKDKDLSFEKLERKAILLSVDWLVEAAKYNPPDRSPGSPYVGSLEEAIAWSRLGNQVKRQLRGMRQKIGGINLSNIKRFIGRSGDNKYEKLKKQIDEYVEYLDFIFGDFIQNDLHDKRQLTHWEQELADGKISQEEFEVRRQKLLYRRSMLRKNDFEIREKVLQINQDAVENLHKEYQSRFDDLDRLAQKKIREILHNAEVYKLSDDERKLQLENVKSENKILFEKLQEEYSRKIESLLSRGPHEIVSDARNEQKRITEDYEKHKSLAQMALDLHFAYNHENGKNYNDLLIHVDFINQVSFSDLKLLHYLWRHGKHEMVNRYIVVKLNLPEGESLTGDSLSDENFVVCLLERGHGCDYLFNHKDDFDFKNLIKSEKVVTAIYNFLVDFLKYNLFDKNVYYYNIDLINFFKGLLWENKNLIFELSKDVLIFKLFSHQISFVEVILSHFLEDFDRKRDILKLEDVKQAAKKVFFEILRSGSSSDDILKVIKIRDNFLLADWDSIEKSEDFQLAIQDGILESFRSGGEGYFEEITQNKDFRIPNEFFTSEKFYAGVKKAIIFNFSKIHYYEDGCCFRRIEKLLDYLPENDNDFYRNDVLKEGLSAAIDKFDPPMYDGVDVIDKIIKRFFNNDSRILKSSEIISVFKEKFYSFLSSYSLEDGQVEYYDLLKAKKLRQKYLQDVDIFVDSPNKVKDAVYLYFGDRSAWRGFLGDARMNLFMETVKNRTDKTQDVARNAFTHTDLDRVSKFLKFLYKKQLFELNGDEFDIVTEYIDKYSLATNGLLYSYFRALKFLNLQNGESPVKKLLILSNQDKKIPKGITYDLCLQMEKDGISSLEILNKKYKDFTSLLYSGKKMDLTYLKNISDFEIALLSVAIGYDTHSFRGSGISLKEMIENFVSYQSDRNHKSFPVYKEKEKNYVPISFNCLKIEYEFKADELSDQSGYFQTLRQEFLSILKDDLTHREIFEDIKESVLLKLNKVLLEKKEHLSKSDDRDYAVKKIKVLMDEIKNLQIIGSKILDGDRDLFDQKINVYDELLIHILSLDKSVIKILEGELRKIIFHKAVKKSGRGSFRKLEEALRNNEISIQSVFGMVNMLAEPIGEHILDKENNDKVWNDITWKAILEAKRNRKYDLFKLFKSQLLRLTEISRNMKMVESVDGFFSIKCYPCFDDFLGEVSGYLGNACYTKVYPLLARYPTNLIPFKFVYERGGDEKELFGSLLVFELKDSAGNSVALLRAFNIPRESEVDVGKFIENFIDKISHTLKARGIKRILVPGLDGAISNYVSIRNYIYENYIQGSKPVSLSRKFDFNGYDITNNCYVAREL